MRVLVIGNGAREHALCLALAHDPSVTALVCAPGNAGTAAVAEQRGVEATDPAAVAGLEPLESGQVTDDRLRTRLDEPATGQYLVVWITSLPPVGGDFRAEIAEVVVSR